MNATVDDVLIALELLSARVPDRHVSPDKVMASAWLADLERFDKAVVFAAARAWGELSFPSAVQFVEACQTEARTIASQRAESNRALAGVDGPHGCENGWVEADATGQGTYRPCEVCRPVEHAVWAHRTDPSHPERCGECAKVRKGTKKDRPGWLVAAYEREAENGLAAEPAF